jgi:hypothetical protein
MHSATSRRSESFRTSSCTKVVLTTLSGYFLLVRLHYLAGATQTIFPTTPLCETVISLLTTSRGVT